MFDYELHLNDYSLYRSARGLFHRNRNEPNERCFHSPPRMYLPLNQVPNNR